MIIRPALLSDLDGCLALNADSQTGHVWQMEQRQDNGHISIRFQPVRLPRVMHVAYPRQRDDLAWCWNNGSTVLVSSDKSIADLSRSAASSEADAPPVTAQIFGYVQFDVSPWQKAGWISHLIVGRPFRRQGIATAFLKAGVAWARSKKLSRLMVAVQTKNHPAISFCEKNGFGFCGFNDHYFVNRDIALFFSLNV